MAKSKNRQVNRYKSESGRQQQKSKLKTMNTANTAKAVSTLKKQSGAAVTQREMDRITGNSWLKKNR